MSTNIDMLTEYVHVGITGARYHPLFLRDPINLWVLAREDDPSISLPGFYTTEGLAEKCNIDNEELIFIKLKYCC